jgi:hypothetical protein
MWTWFTRRVSVIGDQRSILRLESLESREVPAILIQLDYSYDAGFFTNNPGARAIMDRVAAELGNSISANLAAIVPSGGNTWSASFYSPATGGQVSIPNLVIGANTIRLYVGGRALPGAEAGFGGPGGYSISGTQAWINTIQTRGWSGFSLWGGSITFDTTQNWHFGETIDGLASNELDFYSVATHELGHVLGIGTANRWNSLVQGGYFRGANAMAVYGGPVPLAAGGAHWADGVTVAGQPVSLDPTLTYGRRVNWSSLDAAGLRDLGWGATVIPSPLPAPAPTPAPAPAPIPQPTPPTFNRVPLSSGTPVAFTGSTNGVVTMYTVTNGVLSATGQLIPFANYAGAIRVAGGDFNGDGIQDYAFTVGAGPQAVVQIMNGGDGSILVNQTAIFPGFRGGLFVAAADIDRDGKAELVVSADAGAGPHIQTFRVEGGGLQLQSSFFAFDNPAYRGGARVAAGDLNRDGFADVVVTTGGIAEGRVAMYSGAELARGVPTRLYGDFLAFPRVFAGLNAAVGDMDGDGFGELAVTIDRGGPAHVKVWSGAMMATGTYIGHLSPVASFYAFPPNDPNGARLAMRDMNGDGVTELVVASGNRLNSMARVFNYGQAVAGGSDAPIFYPLGTPTSYDGVYAGLHTGDDQLAPAPVETSAGDATYTVTATPVSHQCNCAGCRALTELVNTSDEGEELLATIPVA